MLSINTIIVNTVEPGYNDIGLCNTSPVTSDALWYQLIRHCNHNTILLGYNDTRL
jgi:hypothetical protein